jgi:hypothetical protein
VLYQRVKEHGKLLETTRQLDYSNSENDLSVFYRVMGREQLVSAVEHAYEGLQQSMEKYASIENEKIQRETMKSIQELKTRFEGVSTVSNLFLDLKTLELTGLLKSKHYFFASYISSISSFPILYRVAPDSLSSSIFAKTSSSLSVKLLDNVNDRIHSVNQAVKSLRLIDAAFTNSEFEFEVNKKVDDTSLAENTAFLLARWTYDILNKNVSARSDTFRAYCEDVHTMIGGQLSSLKQKIEENDIPASTKLSIEDYLKMTVEKGIGTLWGNIDLCFYENDREYIDDKEKVGIDILKNGIDYVFKSTLIYDDVSDLIPDLNEDIVNIVVILGVERGLCDIDDVKKLDPKVLMKKLGKTRVIEDAIKLADVVFLKGIDQLQKAKTYSMDWIDIDALLFTASLLRMFNLRKWVLETKDFRSINLFLKSFDDFENLKDGIPDYIFAYEKYL